MKIEKNTPCAQNENCTRTQQAAALETSQQPKTGLFNRFLTVVGEVYNSDSVISK